MRILTVEDDCTALGGSNSYRRELRDLLRSRGIEVALFTQAIEDAEDERPYACYRHIESARGLRHIEFYYLNLPLVRALRRWIRAVRPDVIHLHNAYRYPTSVLLACHGTAPVIQTLHDFRLLCLVDTTPPPAGRSCERCLDFVCPRTEHHPVTRPFFRLAHDVLPKTALRWAVRRTVRRFLVPSRALQEDLGRFGLPTAFLGHLVDVARYALVGEPQGPPTVLFVGALEPTKGVDGLLRAFERAVVAAPRARLEIVGEGPMEPALRRLSAELGVSDRVTFPGRLPREQVRDRYEAAHVVVLPSVVRENSPLVICEAMASARPVVASRIGGIPELVVDGETGLLFTPGDWAELADRLAALLADPGRARRMGAKARAAAAQRFAPERHLAEYLALLADVRRTSGSRTP